MKSVWHYIMVSAAACALLTACGSDKDLKVADKPVEVLYNDAANAMQEGDNKKASQLFDEVERQHPYSEWATRAELMSAYALYRNTDYEEAVGALDRFAELHPGNKDIDYALYLRSLCYYEQISDVARDQEITQKALDSLNALIQRFPDSKYSRDATLKRDLTLDHLAGKEMEIGRYYLNRKEVNAAINRFLAVVKTYQTTTHVPEALHRLVESYLTLGLKNEATRIAAVLGYNYPGSKWYAETYKLLDDQQRQKLIDKRSFVDRTVDSLFKPD